MMRRVLIVVLALALVGIACGDDDGTTTVPVTSVLSEDQAIDLADGLLTAFHDGDYAAFTANWSAAMTGAIDEAAFLANRAAVLADAGEYVGITDAELVAASTAGFVRWVFTADFTVVDQVFSIVMLPTDTVIEGSRIVPAG